MTGERPANRTCVCVLCRLPVTHERAARRAAIRFPADGTGTAPSVDGGRELPVPVDPRVGDHLKPADQLLAVHKVFPRDGFQDAIHYQGGLGGIRRTSPQHCRHGIILRPVKPALLRRGVIGQARSRGLRVPPMNADTSGKATYHQQSQKPVSSL
jgi:hypothetical protein